MKIQKHNDIAIITEIETKITDTGSALDFMMTVNYESGSHSIVITKEMVDEDFFRLSSGIAGEILQKFVTYQFRLAICGDYSGYTSKPLKDFIYECNNGRHIYFVPTVEEAIKKLEG